MSKSSSPAKSGPLRVVLDSNIIIADFRLARPLFTQVLGALDQIGATLYIPQLVVDETVNKFAEQLRERAEKFRKALEEIARMLGRELPLPGIDIAKETDAYRRFLVERLRLAKASLLPYPAIPHERVVVRALARRRPFDPEGRRGYRDALIWQSILDLAATEGPDIVFVTQNSADFANADKGTLHAHLVDDLEALKLAAGRVIFCDGLDRLNKEHFAPRLPSAAELAKALEANTVPGFEMGTWIAETLPSLFEEWSFEPGDLNLPSAYQELRLIDLTGVTAFKVTAASELPDGKVALQVETEVEGQFEFTIARADIEEVRRERKHPSLRRFGPKDKYTWGSDIQVFVATIAVTFDRQTAEVVDAEVADVSGGWPLGSRWRPD